jgi:hypothetical protein
VVAELSGAECGAVWSEFFHFNSRGFAMAAKNGKFAETIFKLLVF